jgi:hypothetical protein
MATFEEQVETLTEISILAGSVPVKQADLTQWLTDGAIDVISKVIALSPEKKGDFSSTTEEDDNSGVPSHFGIDGVVSVVRESSAAGEYRACDLIAAGDRYEAKDSESLKYRSQYNPAWYYLDGNVYAVPTPVGASHSILVTAVANPSVAYNATGISNFPASYYRLVVLYGAIKVLNAEIQYLNQEWPSFFSAGSELEVPSFSVTSPTLPEPPSNIGAPNFSLPSFTYENAEIGDLHLGSEMSIVSEYPSFNMPALYVPILPSFNDISLSEQPSPPGLALDYEIKEGTSSQLFGSISEPTFTKPDFALPADPGFEDFTISAVSPGAPPVPSFTVAADLEIGTLGLPPAPLFERPDVPGTGSELPDINSGDSAQATDRKDLSKLYDIVTDYIVNEEDTELASAIQGHIGTIMNAYTQQVATNMNEYNAASARYQQEVQGEMNRLQRLEANNKDNRDHRFQRETQQYSQELAAWNARLQEYTTAVQNEVTEYTTDTNLKMQVFTANVNNEIQTYVNEMQGRMNEYQKELSIYQQKIQLATAEAGNRNTEDSQKLALFGQQLAQLQASNADVLQEFQQNEVQNKFNVWNQEFSNEVSKFQALLGAEQQRFQSEVTKYNQEVQVEMTNLANKQAALQGLMQQQTQLNTTNKQQKITTEIQEFTQKTAIEQAEYQQKVQNFTNELNKYSQEITKFTQQHTLDLNNYNTEVAEFNAQLQARQQSFSERTQEFNLNTSIITNKIQHAINRQTILKTEYDEAFGIEKMTAQSKANLAQQQQNYQNAGEGSR